MKHAPAFPTLCLFSLAAVTLTACASSSMPPAASTTTDAPAVLFSSFAGSERSAPAVVGAEAMFGNWRSQVIRRPQAGKQGPPYVYEGGQFFDADKNEIRPKLDLTLAEDGTYCLITNYGPQTSARTFVVGTWSWNGSRVSLTQEGEVTWDFLYRGGKLMADKREDNSSVILGR